MFGYWVSFEFYDLPACSKQVTLRVRIQTGPIGGGGALAQTKSLSFFIEGLAPGEAVLSAFSW